MKTTDLPTIATCLFLLVSCGEKTTETNETSAVPKAPSTALSAVLAAAPAGQAMAITAARASAKPGDEVTLSGRIMGNAKPFVDGRAAFMLADPAVLTACSDVPGDECETPWDNCCDSPEDKKRGTATIQIVDAAGRVLKEPVEGVGGLEKLAHVTVTGTIAEGSSSDLLIVNATAIRTGK